MNIYRFEFQYTDVASDWGCYIDAPDTTKAWQLFEALHPPKTCVVQRMFLFWDGVANRPATRRAVTHG